MSAATYYSVLSTDGRWFDIDPSVARRMAAEFAERPDAMAFRVDIFNDSPHRIRAGQALQDGPYGLAWGMALENIASFGRGTALVSPETVSIKALQRKP